MLWILLACSSELAVGDFRVTESDDGSFDVVRYDGKRLLSDLRFAAGEGTERLEMQAGSYRLASGSTEWTELTPTNRRGESIWLYDLADADGNVAATLAISANASRELQLNVKALGGNRLRLDAACTGDDRFVGGGEHAMDVNHAGFAFPLWVSEPGIGKSTSDVTPGDWFLTGTRHASAYPDPFFIRNEPLGILTDTLGRVEVDLCTGSRWRFDVWGESATWLLFDGDSPLELVEMYTLRFGSPALPPDWAFGAWADAVRGQERVESVAAKLRAAGASVSVLWSEDWRGGVEGNFGYHPRPEWEVDTTLYPDPQGIDAGLEALGFKWLAYFQPFLVEGSGAWDEAIQHAFKDSSGAPLTFVGANLDTVASVDLSDPDAMDWVVSKLDACADLGFDGWMTDYGEWIPPDAEAAGMDPVAEHNLYPLLWQQASAEALDGRDATFFARSGWSGSPTIAPVHWPGDQRTSFDADDGFPTVVPLLLGASIAGVPFSGSDIAGYQSLGNDPSTKELWMRWAALGAFSPIMRTHHGAFSDECWQFDSDEETLAAFAKWTDVHGELFPYLRGLAALAVNDGTPLLRAPFMHYPDEDWGRIDAWLLGPSLFVSPVTEEGATTWTVGLPEATEWYDWWTGEPVGSGEITVDAPLDSIPVFAPAGSVVPLFASAPDSFVAGPLSGITTLSDADTARVVKVFAGASGSFTEADGTSYTTSGEATGSGTVTEVLTSGTLSAGGLSLKISGSVERTYTLQVYR